jgi:hypothetical protein
MQRDWIDYANAGGSIATALTLIIVLFKEWKTRKDVTDLTVIVKELQARNQYVAEKNEREKTKMKLAAKPVLTLRASSSMRDIGLKIINTSLNDAYLDRMESTGDVTFAPFHPVLLNGRRNVIRIEVKSEKPSASQSDFVVAIYFHDIYGNNYRATARYNGSMSDTEIHEV